MQIVESVYAMPVDDPGDNACSKRLSIFLQKRDRDRLRAIQNLDMP